MDDEISGTKLICVSPKGDRFSVIVSIGRPYRDEDNLWVCPVGLEGLYPKLSPMKSDDSFHALCLGIFLIRNLLGGFIASGGRILIEGTDDEEFPMNAYFPPPH